MELCTCKVRSSNDLKLLFNIFRPEFRLNYVHKFNSYFIQNTLRFVTKTGRSVLFGEMIFYVIVDGAFSKTI